MDNYFLVNKRISIYWPSEKKWYNGVVQRLSDNPKKGSHEILYDDSQEIYERLTGPKAVKYKLINPKTPLKSLKSKRKQSLYIPRLSPHSSHEPSTNPIQTKKPQSLLTAINPQAPIIIFYTVRPWKQADTYNL